MYLYIYNSSIDVLYSVTPVVAVVATALRYLLSPIAASDREEDGSLEQPKAGQEERREFRAFWLLRVSFRSTH